MAETRHRAIQAGLIAWSIIGVLILLGVVLWALGHLGIVVFPLLVALLPAAALGPLRQWLVRHGWPAALAALALVLALVGLVVGAIAGPIPIVASELPRLGESLSAGAQQIDELIRRLPGGQEFSGLGQLTGQFTAALFGGEGVSGTLSAAASAIEVLTGIVLTLIAVFFYLYQGDRITRGITSLLPPRARADSRELSGELLQTLGAYVRAQLLIGLIDAVLIGTGLALLGVPLALPLALLVFLGAQVPIVGALVSGTVAVIVAFAHGGIGLALAVLAIIIVVQQLEGHLIAPLLMSRLIRIPAFGVILVVTAGAALLGVLGALLAVPLTACVVRVVQFLRSRRTEAVPPEPGMPPKPPAEQPVPAGAVAAD
jgi:predicted PurR-regulated permease PerM